MKTDNAELLLIILSKQGILENLRKQEIKSFSHFFIKVFTYTKLALLKYIVLRVLTRITVHHKVQFYHCHPQTSSVPL